MSQLTEDFLSKLLNESLGDLDQDGSLAELGRAQARADRDKARAEAAVVKAALDSEAGVRFLVWLANKTVLRGESEQERGAVTAEAYAIASARRRGQNGVFFAIVEALNWKGDDEHGEIKGDIER